MSLSESSKEILVVAMANRKAAEEVAAAIDSNGSGPAASIAAISSSNMAALVPVAATISNSTSTAVAPTAPTMAEVNTAIDAASAKVITALAAKADNVDAETLRTEAEARLDAIETKINAVIAALKAVGMMAP